MTMRQKKGLAGATLTSALALTVLVAGGVMARSALETVHIELVVEEMAFRGPGPGGSATPVDNPTLEVRTGQSVKITLRSIDRGMKHDLMIPDLGIAVEAVGYGETASVRFTAPAPGTYSYLCSMHPKLMRGQIVVVP